MAAGNTLLWKGRVSLFDMEVEYLAGVHVAVNNIYDV